MNNIGDISINELLKILPELARINALAMKNNYEEVIKLSGLGNKLKQESWAKIYAYNNELTKTNRVYIHLHNAILDFYRISKSMDFENIEMINRELDMEVSNSKSSNNKKMLENWMKKLNLKKN